VLACLLREPLRAERDRNAIFEDLDHCIGVDSIRPSLACIRTGPTLMRVERSLDAVQCPQRSDLGRETLQLCAEVLQDRPQHVIHRCKCAACHPNPSCGTETLAKRTRSSRRSASAS